MLREHASLTASSKKVQREVAEEAAERLFLRPNNQRVAGPQFGKTLENCGENPFRLVAAQIDPGTKSSSSPILNIDDV